MPLGNGYPQMVMKTVCHRFHAVASVFQSSDHAAHVFQEQRASAVPLPILESLATAATAPCAAARPPFGNESEAHSPLDRQPSHSSNLP